MRKVLLAGAAALALSAAPAMAQDSGQVIQMGAGNQTAGCSKVLIKRTDGTTQLYGRANTDPGLDAFNAVAVVAALKGWNFNVEFPGTALDNCKGAIQAFGVTTNQP